METRRPGAAGSEVSVVGLGCNNFGMGLDEEGTREVVRSALQKPERVSYARAGGRYSYDPTRVYSSPPGPQLLADRLSILLV
jgi:aryl-alcohol dehydrogenase-like predicted oxidoreductase